MLPLFLRIKKRTGRFENNEGKLGMFLGFSCPNLGTDGRAKAVVIIITYTFLTYWKEHGKLLRKKSIMPVTKALLFFFDNGTRSSRACKEFMVWLS